MQDLKDLVNKAHELDMKIIIDWVANHTAWDHAWTVDHPDYYTKDSLGNFMPPVADWSDVIDLNYDNAAMRQPSLYGTQVARKVVDGVLSRLERQGSLFLFDHERLELSEFFTHPAATNAGAQ